MNSEIITISEASQMLGVSEPALRAWTDEGKIKAFITPGGHRRYLKSELRKFIGLNQQRLGIKVLAQKLEETASVHREIGAALLSSTPAGDHVEQEIIDQFTLLGRELLSLLTRCISKPSSNEDVIQAAHDIGVAYGRLTRKVGMPLPESVRAFISHRQPILDSIFEMMKKNEMSEYQIITGVSVADRAIDEAILALIEERQNISSNTKEML